MKSAADMTVTELIAEVDKLRADAASHMKKASPGPKKRFEIRLPQADIARIDAWRDNQDDAPSRSEAVRQLIEYGLIESGLLVG